jgi:hypothetical protein
MNNWLSPGVEDKEVGASGVVPPPKYPLADCPLPPKKGIIYPYANLD